MKILIHLTAAILVLIALDHGVFLHAFGNALDTSELPCNRTCLYTASFQHADCRSRGLSRIPPQCSSSVYLDFRNNDLQYLSRASLNGYATLRYLYLENNTIRNITPGAFTACHELREIFLQHNPIVTIEAQTFRGLTALRNLYLNYVNLEVIEADAFVGLSSLERLFLSDNALRTLPQGVFNDLRTLEILILSNNHLRYLLKEQFQGLGQLRILDIQHNQISRLGEGLFRGLPSLKALNLSNNALSEVLNGALDFVSLVNLETLDMCNNNILSTSNFSEHLVNIRNVFFAGNPMDCGCGSKLLMKWYEQHVHSDSSLMSDNRVEVICHSPEDLVGIPMKNVTMVSCTKHHSRANLLFQNNEQNPEEISPDIETTIRTESLEALNNGGQIQAAGVHGKSSSGNTQQEGNMYMFIGIAVLLLCGAVVVFIATVLYARYKRSSENRRREQESLEKEKQQIPLRITENPVPEKHEEGEDDVYEHISSMPDFPTSRRRRLVSEKSTDSAYWEDYPDSEDLPPPSHPPPPPPPIGKSMPSLQEPEYIPVFQNQNGKVYLCTQCPHTMHTIPTGRPILMHSVSVPSHCTDLPHYRPHSQSQPLIPHQQNPFPEGYQSHCVPSSTQIPHQQVEAVPSYAHPMKYQMSDATFQAQNQMPYTQTNPPQQGQLQDNPPIPLQTDIASYSQLDMMKCYPNTNPFASSQMVQSNPNPTQPRRVSFSNVTTVHNHNNPVCT